MAHTHTQRLLFVQFLPAKVAASHSFECAAMILPCSQVLLGTLTLAHTDFLFNPFAEKKEKLKNEKNK